MRRISVSRIGVFALAAVTAAAYSAVCATSASSAATRSLTPGPDVKSFRLTGIQHVKARIGASSSAIRRYVVRNGDTLSAIAQRQYGSAGCWPGIYRGNTSIISNPDLIYPGQQFRMPGECDTRPVRQYVTVAAVRPRHQESESGESDSPARSAPAAAVVQQPVSAPVQASSSFQACVISRESGGNAQVMNSSGHYGLYQFSYSTWVGAGGSGALFGHASAAYQTQIFWNAFRLWGTSPWAPYDGC